jgi:hypothetical protein
MEAAKLRGLMLPGKSVYWIKLAVMDILIAET